MKNWFVFLLMIPVFAFNQVENECINYNNNFDTISSKRYKYHKAIIDLYKGKNKKIKTYDDNRKVINNFIASQDFIALIIHLDTSENQFYQEYSTVVIKTILFKENFKAIKSALIYIYNQKPYYNYFLNLISESQFSVSCRKKLIRKINLIKEDNVDEIRNFKKDLTSKIH